MKNKKYHNVRTIPKSHTTILERGKIDTPDTQIHDCSLSCLFTSASIKPGGVKLVVWAQTSLLNEMMWSCKCFRHGSKMSTLIYNLGKMHYKERYNLEHYT